MHHHLEVMAGHRSRLLLTDSSWDSSVFRRDSSVFRMLMMHRPRPLPSRHRHLLVWTSESLTSTSTISAGTDADGIREDLLIMEVDPDREVRMRMMIE